MVPLFFFGFNLGHGCTFFPGLSLDGASHSEASEAETAELKRASALRDMVDIITIVMQNAYSTTTLFQNSLHY